MSHPVFISYARKASGPQARGLAGKLGDLAFLDTADIDDGDQFPERLLEGVLGARVVVIVATRTYSERRFCRLEMRLALAGGEADATHLVLALGGDATAVLDAMPAMVVTGSWPAAEEVDRLETLVRRSLDKHSRPIRSGLPEQEAQSLVRASLEASRLPEPSQLAGMPCSLPEGASSAEHWQPLRRPGGRFTAHP